MDSSIMEIVKVLREIGVLGLLALILVGGFKKWWVFGWHFDRVCQQYESELKDLRDERDQWKNLVIGAHVRDRRAQETATT